MVGVMVGVGRGYGRGYGSIYRGTEAIICIVWEMELWKGQQMKQDLLLSPFFLTISHRC